MVVVSAPDVDKICESFTYKPLMRSWGNPNFISLIGIHKELIDNAK